MIQMIIEKFPILAPHQHHGNSNVGQHGPGGVHLNKASRRVHDIDPMKDKFPRIVSIQWQFQSQMTIRHWNDSYMTIVTVEFS